MPLVRLGNTAPLDCATRQQLGGTTVTEIKFFDEDPVASRVRSIVHADGHWPTHSQLPAAWVESDDAALADALAEHFDCPIGRPDDWE